MTLLHWARPAVALRPAQLSSDFPAHLAFRHRLHRSAVASQIPVTAGDEVQRGGFREEAGRAADQIWGGEMEEAHRRGLFAVEWIGSRGRRMTSRSCGCRHSWNSRRGTPWRREARGGVEGVRERPEEASTGEVVAAE
jgi:hypothetical protein